MISLSQHSGPAHLLISFPLFLFLAAVFSFLSSGCEREILTADVAEVIEGYEIRGYVYDRLKNPIPNVSIYLEYGLALVDTDAPPDETYTVPVPGETLTVTVRTRDGGLYRSFPTTRVDAGQFSFDWDRLDLNGGPAPPGVYIIRISAGSAVRLEYPVMVIGTRVARTDTLGRYTIPNDNLPVDFYPVPQYSSDGTRFFGNYRITELVYASFVTPGAPDEYRAIELVEDRVVLHDVTFR